MPNMSDVTVKKADGTTNITYTGLNPAGGDGIPAIFRSQTVGTTPGFKPEVRVLARAKKGERVVRLTARYPNVKTIGGVETLASQGSKMTLEFQLDESQNQSDIDEASAQFLNFANSTLFKDCTKTGFPPT